MLFKTRALMVPPPLCLVKTQFCIVHTPLPISTDPEMLAFRFYLYRDSTVCVLCARLPLSGNICKYLPSTDGWSALPFTPFLSLSPRYSRASGNATVPLNPLQPLKSFLFVALAQSNAPIAISITVSQSLGCRTCYIGFVQRMFLRDYGQIVMSQTRRIVH